MSLNDLMRVLIRRPICDQKKPYFVEPETYFSIGDELRAKFGCMLLAADINAPNFLLLGVPIIPKASLWFWA